MSKKNPINCQTEEELEETNGIVVEKKTVRKGLLNQITRSVKHDPSGLGWHLLEPRGDDQIAIDSLLEMKLAAKNILRAAGLPSDLPRPYLVLSLEDKLEPLSLEECAACLIEGVDDLLSHKDKMIALHALKFATALHDFVLAGGLNEYAVGGAKAVENRKRGPQKREDAASKTTDFVADICKSFWAKKENHRGNAKSTSEKGHSILEDLNKVLKQNKLRPLKTRTTLAVHIRLALKKFPEMANPEK